MERVQEAHMNRFEKLRIQGFRRLADMPLELRGLSVLIGANGIGKTSILDGMALLASSAEGRLGRALDDLGGVAGLLTRERAQKLQFDLSMAVPNHAPLDYTFSIAPQGGAYVFEEEHLTQVRLPGKTPFKHIQAHGGDVRYFEVDSGHLVRPTWEHNPRESSLSEVPKMFREPEDFRRALASCTFYHALDVDPRAPVRLPQPMRPASLPGRNGEDLVSCLFYLREAERNRFDAVEDTLRAAFPAFERLDFPPVAAGTLAMTWRDRSFLKPIYTHELSEGMLRFLWLAALLQSPGLTALTLIDEPEVSLHPELLSLLAGLLREASERSQLVIATHSDRLVRFLQPSEVVVMDLEDDGSARATWADRLDLERWLADYTLDEVWRLGRMGGRA
jgi:predicted ATPase